MDDGASTAEIRRWARGEGMPVAVRGRLAPEIVRAFDDAHGATPHPAGPDKASPGPAGKRTPSGVRLGNVVRAKEHWDWKRRESR